MRTCVIIFFLLALNLGYSQVQQENMGHDSLNQQDVTLFELDEPVEYVLNREEFTFTPEEYGIRIRKIEGDQEVDYGNLRKTTDDGLYVLTSVINEDVSFGRFDSSGNFRTLRYDRIKDSVFEENYTLVSSRKD